MIDRGVKFLRPRAGRAKGGWSTQREPGITALVAPPPEEAFETAEMSAMARSFYASSARVSNAKLKRELGVKLAYPTYRHALDALWRAGEGR